MQCYSSTIRDPILIITNSNFSNCAPWGGQLQLPLGKSGVGLFGSFLCCLTFRPLLLLTRFPSFSPNPLPPKLYPPKTCITSALITITRGKMRRQAIRHRNHDIVQKRNSKALPHEKTCKFQEYRKIEGVCAQTQ